MSDALIISLCIFIPVTVTLIFMVWPNQFNTKKRIRELEKQMDILSTCLNGLEIYQKPMIGFPKWSTNGLNTIMNSTPKLTLHEKIKQQDDEINKLKAIVAELTDDYYAE